MNIFSFSAQFLQFKRSNEPPDPRGKKRKKKNKAFENRRAAAVLFSLFQILSLKNLTPLPPPAVSSISFSFSSGVFSDPAAWLRGWQWSRKHRSSPWTVDLNRSGQETKRTPSRRRLLSFSFFPHPSPPRKYANICLHDFHLNWQELCINSCLVCVRACVLLRGRHQKKKQTLAKQPSH